MTSHTDAMPLADAARLQQLRQRFFQVNQARLERALCGMSPLQQQVIRLLPLLLHLNQRHLPGYVSALTPAGVEGFDATEPLLHEAGTLSPVLAENPAPLAAPSGGPWQILGLFLMGSLGTLAQAGQSDLDIWVCHAPDLSPGALMELECKCERLELWAASLGADAHFYLVNPRYFAQGRCSGNLSTDHCGSSQHYLLLDEFYRTAIWLAGRPLLWWLVPAHEEQRFEAYAAALFSQQLLAPDEVLDLGHLGRIPPGEFVSAALWQLYQAVRSPYKAVIKLLLTEVYASEYPKVDCLGLRFKQAVHDNRLGPDGLDPYLAVYRRLEEYLNQRQQPERLELVRRCLYLKVSSQTERSGWQQKALARLLAEWCWEPPQLRWLDQRAHWKVDDVLRERRCLVTELTDSFRALNEFARQHPAESPLNNQDLLVLGRQLYAVFSRKPGKIDFINPGISLDLSEAALTLSYHPDSRDGQPWLLHRGLLPRAGCTRTSGLKNARELMALLAWCHRNGIIQSHTRLTLHPGSSGLELRELQGLLHSLHQALPVPLKAVSEQALLGQARPRQVLLLANVGLDRRHCGRDRPYAACHPDAGQHIRSMDLLTLNSWNELMLSRHEGPAALTDSLCEYLGSLPGRGPWPALRVSYHCRNGRQGIARRIETLFFDAQTRLAADPGSRYLLRQEQQFGLIHLQPGQIACTRLGNRAALLDYLGRPGPCGGRLYLDSQALPGEDLGLLLPLGQRDRLQVFYRYHGTRVQVSVLDECNALWQHELPAFLLAALLDFLQAVTTRNPDSSLYCQSPETHELPGSAAEPHQEDAPETTGHCHYFQAVIEAREEGPEWLTLYCGPRRFSQREYASTPYAALARHLLEKRTAARWPCCLTRLELPGHYTGPLQTLHYLNRKLQLEQALQQALLQASGH